jgi:hypothetical protein
MRSRCCVCALLLLHVQLLLRSRDGHRPFPSNEHLCWIHNSGFQQTRHNMKPLIMQISPASCYFHLVWPKYSPQHPVLKYPQPALLPCCERQTSQKSISFD